jgi:ADP-ribose pyrophosphatase
LDAYQELAGRYPDAFLGREHRPIIRDRDTLEAYAARHGIVLGVAATTPYVHFIVDLVEGKDAGGAPRAYPYQRILYRGQLEGGVNTVVLATIAEPSLGRVGDIVLVEQERHATGRVENELPRGFGKPGLTGGENALAELREETGFIGNEAHWLGSTLTDSGATDARVTFHHVPVTGRSARAPEPEEAIVDIRLLSIETAWREVATGAIHDGFTVQALALFERPRRP